MSDTTSTAPVTEPTEADDKPQIDLNQPFYSPTEVAILVDVGAQTVHRWIKDEKITPAASNGLGKNKVHLFANDQLDALRALKVAGRSGKRGSGEYEANPFSVAFLAWRTSQTPVLSQQAMADSFGVDPEGNPNVTLAQVGRWERGQSLPTAENARDLLTINADLLPPYIDAKAIFAERTKAKREQKKAEKASADVDEAARAAVAAGQSA